MTTESTLDCHHKAICQLQQDQKTLEQNQIAQNGEIEALEALNDFEQTTIAFVGDMGQVNSEQTNMATLLANMDPDQIFLGGDNFYGGDTIENIKAWMDAFIDQGIVWPCWGNHDWRDFDLQDCIDVFPYLPGPAGGRYYSKYFEQGNLHLFSISSDTLEPDGNFVGSTQETYIASEIANSTARWKVAMFHHPPFSPRSNSSDPGMYIANLQWPVLQECDLVLVGHGHLDWFALWDNTAVANCSSPVRPLRVLSASQTLYGAPDGNAGLLWSDDQERHVAKLVASPNRLRISWHRHENNPGASSLIDYAYEIS